MKLWGRTPISVGALNCHSPRGMASAVQWYKARDPVERLRMPWGSQVEQKGQRRWRPSSAAKPTDTC